MTTELPPLTLQIIEQQLQHKGAFSPVGWLLDCGLLPYRAYEQWRNGELDTLEEAVDCRHEELLALLQNAQRQARALKLTGEPQTYHDWRPERAGRELALSRHSALRELLALRWLRPQDLPQLDLFMDSGAASAENGLIHCLAGRRWDEAEAAYHQLCEVAPGNARLGAYETLVLYGKHIGANPGIDAGALADELAGLEEDIAPPARELLGEQARDYLAPAWQRLARALPTRHFDPQQPARHASHAWAQIPDWPQVIDSIEAVADFHRHFPLLRRLAEALHRCRQQEAALLLWGYLFELSPEAAEREIETQPIDRLRRHWHSFADSDGVQSMHFPAFMLLREPGLLYHLEQARHPVPGGEAFEAARRLLQARAQGADEMAERRTLQVISPELLRVYLQRNRDP